MGERLFVGQGQHPRQETGLEGVPVFLVRERIAIAQDAIKEAPALWAGALSLGEETPKEGKQ
jgi:hypothetical protein